MRIFVATTVWQRFRGLIGRPELKAGEGLLIPNCRQVHTFFMSYSLDVIFIDAAGRIVAIVNGMAPWCVSKRVPTASRVLELKAREAPGSGFKIGANVAHLVPDTRGQAAVEAALIVPMLLFLILGIFVLGSWFNAQFVVTAAAREGARQLALTGSCSQLKSAINQTVGVLGVESGNRTKFSVEALPSGALQVGSDVTVRVEYQLPSIADYFKSEYERINKNSLFPFGEVAAAATARMEVAPSSPEDESCASGALAKR